LAAYSLSQSLRRFLLSPISRHSIASNIRTGRSTDIHMSVGPPQATAPRGDRFGPGCSLEQEGVGALRMRPQQSASGGLAWFRGM
jgi:hypothetical protein